MNKQESTQEQRIPAANGGLSRRIVTAFASVKMTVALMVLIATTVLIGAWCPQESQAGQEKIIETFGEQMALNLIQWGIADIFHSPFFLALIGLLTLNMVACSCQRVFPKIRSLRHPMPFLGGEEIGRLPFNNTLVARPEALLSMASKLRKQGYVVRLENSRLKGEFGKYGRLAATITHIGLLTLLLGVTITSWTGFSGFKPVKLGNDLSFQDSEHSKLWIGKLPTWRVHVDATRREDYPTGEAKQWYSDLSIVDTSGRKLKQQQISVNEPLSYDGVDIYQSSWGLDQLLVSFNASQRSLQLRQMGTRYAAFLPLDEATVFIFSLKNQFDSMRLFAKRPQWPSPRLIAELPPGQSIMLGGVKLTYNKVLPITGLQYKSDPGLPITYIAFAFIMVGVLLAAVPHRLVFAAFSEDRRVLVVGGRSVKARVGFERSMHKLIETLKNEHGNAAQTDETSTESTLAAETPIAATKTPVKAQANQEVTI